MYQLLIVDDEPLVQAGIRSMLNWNEMNIDICGTAMNGQAALKITGYCHHGYQNARHEWAGAGKSLQRALRGKQSLLYHPHQLRRFPDGKGCPVLSGLRLSGEAGADSGSAEKRNRPGHYSDLAVPQKADVCRKYSPFLRQISDQSSA